MDKGLKILLNTYWSSQGWKDGSISDADFKVAKSEGYMFDYPIYETHDDTLESARSITATISKQEIANAFLYSLSTRKLEYRSPLASYYYIKSIPKHTHVGEKHCGICDWYGFETNPSEYEKRLGVNVYNFERYKWGGVRHDKLSYAKFDVEQFTKLPKVEYKHEDLQILSLIFNQIKSLPATAKAGGYSRLITSKKILKSCKSEIDIMLGILSMCDVISSTDNRGYLYGFANAIGDRDPVEHSNDYAFPLNRWKARDGINFDAAIEVFGIDFSVLQNTM